LKRRVEEEKEAEIQRKDMEIALKLQEEMNMGKP